MKNEYVCVEIEKADDFIERIEELESRGLVTMSAGHDDKGVWYAILRRDAHAQQTPKGKAAKLLEAMREIKNFCGENACADCMFGYDNMAENSKNSTNNDILTGKGLKPISSPQSNTKKISNAAILYRIVQMIDKEK